MMRTDARHEGLLARNTTAAKWERAGQVAAIGTLALAWLCLWLSLTPPSWPI